MFGGRRWRQYLLVFKVLACAIATPCPVSAEPFTLKADMGGLFSSLFTGSLAGGQVCGTGGTAGAPGSLVVSTGPCAATMTPPPSGHGTVALSGNAAARARYTEETGLELGAQMQMDIALSNLGGEFNFWPQGSASAVFQDDIVLDPAGSVAAVTFGFLVDGTVTGTCSWNVPPRVCLPVQGRLGVNGQFVTLANGTNRLDVRVPVSSPMLALRVSLVVSPVIWQMYGWETFSGEAVFLNTARLVDVVGEDSSGSPVALAIRSSSGVSYPTGVPAPVPEPTTGVLVGLGVIVLASRQAACRVSAVGRPAGAGPGVPPRGFTGTTTVGDVNDVTFAIR